MDVRERQLIKRNIPKLYVYSFFQFFLVLIPVIIPFWQSKGLTLSEIFLLQGIFGAVLIVMDMPAGYFADLFGRKKAMVFGSLISGAGFQILWFGQTFWDFAIYEIILGVGLSLQSGCDVALLYNSMEKLEAPGRKAGVLGRQRAAGTFGEGIASLLGGFLAGYALEYPAYANALAAWAPFLVALTIHEPMGQALEKVSHRENVLLIGRSLFKHSRLLRLVIVSHIFYGFATYCAIWAFQPYWTSRGLDITSFGYLWALNMFMIAAVSRSAHVLEEKLGSVAIVLIIAILPVIGYLGMGLNGGMLGILFGMAFPMTRGLSAVIYQDAINTRVPAKIRATTNAIGSLGVRALFIVFGPLIGHVLETRGPEPMMLMLGYVYVAGFFLITLPLVRERKGFQIV